MKKLFVIVLIVVAAAGLLYVKHHNSTSQQSMKMNMSATSSSLKTSQTTKTNNVAISNFNFTPAVISIRKGTTVTWTNKDGILHTVTADARKGPNSSGLKKDQMYSYTYTETGHFPYHCDIHEDMKGLVVVTD